MHAKPTATNAAFDPLATALLKSAFDEAWLAVQESGSGIGDGDDADAARTILAKHIVELAAAGERNPRELIDSALSHLARSNLASLSEIEDRKSAEASTDAG